MGAVGIEREARPPAAVPADSSAGRIYDPRMPLTGKRILITGGAGFIGTTLATRLVDENEVVAVDNLHRDALSGTDLADHPNFRFAEGDVLDLERLTELAAGCTHVVHAAGIAGVDTVLTSPVRTMRVNVIGTYNALEAAVATLETVERLVEFSTSEVFGQHAFNVQEGHVTTIGSVGEARWTYAVSKLAGEHMAHAYHAELGLPAVSVRPFNVGNARSAVTIYDLATRIKRLTGCPGEIRFVPLHYTDVELRIPNVDKARSLLGF